MKAVCLIMAPESMMREWYFSGGVESMMCDV